MFSNVICECILFDSNCDIEVPAVGTGYTNYYYNNPNNKMSVTLDSDSDLFCLVQFDSVLISL